MSALTFNSHSFAVFTLHTTVRTIRADDVHETSANKQFTTRCQRYFTICPSTINTYYSPTTMAKPECVCVCVCSTPAFYYVHLYHVPGLCVCMVLLSFGNLALSCNDQKIFRWASMELIENLCVSQSDCVCVCLYLSQETQWFDFIIPVLCCQHLCVFVCMCLCCIAYSICHHFGQGER